MSDIASAGTPAAPQRHPTWWMLVISLIAMGALYLQAPERYISLQTPVLTILITLAYVLPWRLPAGGVVPWIVRGTVLTVLILVGPQTRGAGLFFFTDPNTMHLLGTLLAGELLVQHFLPLETPMRLGQLVIAASGVMAAGCSTTEPRYINILAPLFALACFAVTNTLKPLLASSPVTITATPPRKSRRWLLSGTAIVMVVTIGFFTVGAVRIYRNNLDRLAGELLMRLVNRRFSTGMSGVERLGGRMNLANNPERMLQLTGTSTTMYLRGMAYDTYEEGAWLPSLNRRVFASPPAGFLVPADAHAIRVDRLADSNTFIYLPITATGCTIASDAKVEVEEGYRAAVQATVEGEDVRSYSFQNGPEYALQGPLRHAPTDEERKQCLAIPKGVDPGVLELAKTLKQEDPRRTIAAIIADLHAKHQYSLQPNPGPGDPASDFILHPGRNAHCQYFASAATLLLRGCGIPARYASGYFANEVIAPKSMVVRGSDAHAWCEAWLDDVGWVTVEATPASGIPDAARNPLGLWQRIREGFSDAATAIAAFFRSLQWYHIAVAGLSLTLIAVLFQFLQARRDKRRRPIARNYTFPAEAYRQLAAEFERELRELGDAPSGVATWSEHLLDERRQTSPSRHTKQARLDAARRFVEAYNRTRFGQPDDAVAVDELYQLLRKVKDSR